MDTPEPTPSQPATGDGPPVVVVGASAGGVEALKMLVGALPAGLAAPVVVVLHVSPFGTSVLPEILARAGRIPAAAVVDGEPLTPGRVHVAPPDHHVLVENGALRLTRGPRENGHRPAVDPTMRSAAEVYGSRAVGVVLSGTRDDGTAGAAAIKAAGGQVVVQDPEEAHFPAMPLSVIEHVDVDAVLPVAEIAGWIAATADGGRKWVAVAVDPDPSRAQTRFTCPDCGGVMFEERSDALVRYACSVGHAYSPAAFVDENGHSVEVALWLAIRSLEDRGELLATLAERARANEHEKSAAAFARQCEAVRRQADTIRAAVGFPAAPPDDRA